MRRITTLLLALGLAAGCTGTDQNVIGRPAPPVTAPAPEAPVTTTDRAGSLIDQIVTAEWEDDGRLQQYYRDGRPTGYFGGPRFPLVWDGDLVSHWLGFAETSGSGDERGPYDRDLDGLIMLLESSASSDESYTVLNVAPVEVPAGTGLMAALCPNLEGAPRFAARLSFSAEGLTVTRLWAPDPASRRLVATGAAPPDCLAQPAGGRIVGPVGAWHAVSETDRHRLLDLDSHPASMLDWWEFAGWDLPDSTLLMVRNHHDPERADSREAWLGSLLGWDYAGFPLRRVETVLQLPTLTEDFAVTGQCRAASRAQPVLAVIEDPCADPEPARAWLIDAANRRFVETSTTGIECTCEG